MKNYAKITLILAMAMIANLFAVSARADAIPSDALAVISEKLSQEIAKQPTCEGKLDVAFKAAKDCNAKLANCTETEALEARVVEDMSKTCLGIKCAPKDYDFVTHKCKSSTPAPSTGGGKKALAPAAPRDVHLILCIEPSKPSADKKRCECPDNRQDSKGNRGVVPAVLHSEKGITYGACVPTIQLHDDDIAKLQKQLNHVCVLDKPQYKLSPEDEQWMKDHPNDIDEETRQMIADANDKCAQTQRDLAFMFAFRKNGGNIANCPDCDKRLNNAATNLTILEGKVDDLGRRMKKAEDDIKKLFSLVRPGFHFQTWAQGFGIVRPDPQKNSGGFLVGVNTSYCFTERHCALVGGGVGYEWSVTDRMAWDVRAAYAPNLYLPRNENETFVLSLLVGPEFQGGYPRLGPQHSMFGGLLVALQFRFNHVYLEPSVLVGANESVYRVDTLTNNGMVSNFILSDPTWGVKPALTLGFDIH
ncbi:MAG: hypothetical protein WC477_03345 [Patescibacteria group bacterium]